MNNFPDRLLANPQQAFASARMESPVITKLARFKHLQDNDRQALSRITGLQRTVAAHTDIIPSGERAAGVRFVMQGYACQYTVLPDGRRQILALLLPGDECSAHLSVSAYAEYRLCALTEVVVSEAPTQAVLPLVEQHPAIAEALSRSKQVYEATLHERITSLGRRTARERVAHLLCEIFVRSEAIGRTTGLQCVLPLSQADIADVLGLSLVHTNRSLQGLRADRLVRLESRLLTILDLPRLQATAQFTPGYLRGNAGSDDVVPAPGQSSFHRTVPTKSSMATRPAPAQGEAAWRQRAA